MANFWTQPNNYLLQTLVERVSISSGELSLPLSTTDVNVTLISGSLPEGLRLSGTDLVGTPVEVLRESEYTFVLRASKDGAIQDRTLRLRVTGADQPRWVDPEGLLPVGPNGALFVLDNEFIDFQLTAVDSDLPAGDELIYYIEPGDGVLPPGIRLTRDGRLVGVVEPLLALDKNAGNGGYDTAAYDLYPADFGVPSDSGFGSFFYDTEPFGFNFPTRTPRKLNRYYEFAVTVADKTSDPVRRKFQIYVVGDDFVKADNTIMKVSNGVFTADNIDIRTPVWITPADLGYIRADNYATIYLDTLDSNTLEGLVTYSLEAQNDDGSDSVLPPGTELDSISGEVTGYIPGQPAVTRDYKFTVLATRTTVDDDVAVVTLQVYEDTFAGKSTFKIYKLPRGTADGINDLSDLRGRKLFINNKQYEVASTNGLDPDFDQITLTSALQPELQFTLRENVAGGSDSFYVDRLSYFDSLRWDNKELIYNDNERYTVVRNHPYKEWQITSSSGSISIDYAVAGVEEPTGGETLGSAIGRIFGTDLLPVEVISATASSVRFIAPVTQTTTLSRVRPIFNTEIVDSEPTTDLVFTLVDDSRSKIFLESALAPTRSFIDGDVVSLAIFENDVIKRELFTNANLDITNPSKAKTFTISVLGEVDSVLTWLTPKDLGELNANFTSTLRVTAETTLPDSRLLYRIVDGELPAGLRLSYRGEIIGEARQFANGTEKGLTRIDGNNTTFDDGETSFDRVFKFTVEAADRFRFSATTREFTLTISDLDSTLYSNLYIQPLMKPEKRVAYREFVSDPTIFPPSDIYRPNDPSFGLQTDVKMLAYAGIESKDAGEFAAAAAKNHKRRRYNTGDVKRAVAKRPGTDEIVYEVVYLEVIDPAEPTDGTAQKRFKINNKQRITADSSGYDAKEVEYNDDLINSEPRRLRNHPSNNTIKADTDAIVINQEGDVLRYLSNTTNMREEIEKLGKTQRDYLPLWMRTGQNGSIKELGYITAIPLAYCKPGRSADVLLNVQNALANGEFDFKDIDLDVDRYILDGSLNNEADQYIVFANYQFNE